MTISIVARQPTADLGWLDGRIVAGNPTTFNWCGVAVERGEMAGWRRVDRGVPGLEATEEFRSNMAGFALEQVLRLYLRTRHHQGQLIVAAAPESPPDSLLSVVTREFVAAATRPRSDTESVLPGTAPADRAERGSSFE